MSYIKIVILSSILFVTYLKVNGLEDLPVVDENVILKTEAIIRNVTNQLFSDLELDISDNRKKIKQFAAVHNYLVTLTLRDYNNLKDIAQLTRAAQKSKNVSDIFIAAYDDLLRDDKNRSILENNYDLNKEENVVTYINNFIAQLIKLKEPNRTVINAAKKMIVDDEIVLDFPLINDAPSLNYSVENNINVNESDVWTPQVSSRRIFHGERVSIKHFPFMAVVLLFKKFQCAGSIIENDLVITAASCLQMAWNNRFFRESPNYVAVRVGTRFFNGGGEVIPVMEIYFHPGYNPKSLKHNLCILRLYRKINFRKKIKKVKKIKIDFSSSPLPTNTDGITVVGWGPRSSHNRIISPWKNSLAFSVLDYYGLRDCQDIYGAEYVTQQHFCGGFLSQGGGACNRDVGGPGIVDGELAGVISFGSPVCGAPDSPTVFTKLGFYTDWIEEIMEQKVPSHYARTTERTTLDYFYEEPPHMKVTISPKIIVIPTTTEDTETTEEQTTKGNQRTLEEKELYKLFLKTVLSSTELMEYTDILNEDNTLKEKIVANTAQPKPKKEKHSADYESYIADIPKKYTILDKNLMEENNKFGKLNNLQNDYVIGDDAELEIPRKVTVLDPYFGFPTIKSDSDSIDLKVMGRNFDENKNKISDDIVNFIEKSDKQNEVSKKKERKLEKDHFIKTLHEVSNVKQNALASDSTEIEGADDSSKEIGLRIPAYDAKATHPTTDVTITATENKVYNSKQSVSLGSGKHNYHPLQDIISQQKENYKDVDIDLDNMYNFISQKEVFDILDEAINEDTNNENV